MSTPASNMEEFDSLAASKPDWMVKSRIELDLFLTEKFKDKYDARIVGEFIQSCMFTNDRLFHCYFKGIEELLSEEEFFEVFARLGIAEPLFNGMRDSKCVKSWAGWSCQAFNPGYWCDSYTCMNNPY